MSALTKFLGLFKWTKEDLENPSPNFDYFKSISDNLDKIDIGIELENTTNEQQNSKLEILEDLSNQNSNGLNLLKKSDELKSENIKNIQEENEQLKSQIPTRKRNWREHNFK